MPIYTLLQDSADAYEKPLRLVCITAIELRFQGNLKPGYPTGVVAGTRPLPVSIAGRHVSI